MTETANRTGELIRKRRLELQMSQADLAEKAGVASRQIRRYESGEQQPLLAVGVAIAQALKVSPLELAGAAILHRLDLTGDWWMAWQTSHRAKVVITAQPIVMTQHDDLIHVMSTSRGNVTLDDGGYNWQGELRVWDNTTLIGWYVAADSAVNSKGSLYFALHNHGLQARGIWTGMSHDGMILSGWGALAKNEGSVRTIVAELKKSRGDVSEHLGGESS